MTILDYCKHGVYVGGCGIDHMCHACESGWTDATPRELRADLAADALELEELAAWCEYVCHTHGYPLVPTDSVIGVLKRAIVKRMRATREELAEATRWAVDADDDDWRSTRYGYHAIAEREYDAAAV